MPSLPRRSRVKARPDRSLEGKTVNKSQLIDKLAQRFDGNRKQAAHALESVLDTITREVARGEKVAITGFGSFERKVRKAGTARNPATGATIRTKKKNVPKFTPGQDLKNVVSGAKKLPKLTVSAAANATSAAKKATTKKSPAKKTTSTAKSAAKKAPAKKSAAKKAPAKKTSAAKKTAAKKSSTAKKAPAKKTTAAKKTAAKKSSTAKKAPAKKTTAAKKTAKKAAKKS
ncbi:HU family DNA-binding protein [Nocardioides sp.]|uniref:HU family DNA-binding protein n=1 Tax=Nocardioides sp. TaxID=35761 RepID=UPI002ED4AF2B